MRTIIWIALAALVGCATEDEMPEPSQSPATRRFWVDFTESRYSRVVADTAALDGELAVDPGDGGVALTAALARLWHLAEFARDPGQDPAQLPMSLADALASFEQARELVPDDARLYCWLGGLQVLAGRATGDAELAAQGIAEIEEGVEVFPEFNEFCLALAYADLPASAPDFARAPEAVFDLLDTCVGDTLDRDQPDFAPYLDRETHEGRKATCWNDPVTHPHGLEGTFLFLGDLLLKQGRVEPARVAYHDATLLDSYGSWPYEPLLHERLAGDLTARSALLRDADPGNDPPVFGTRTSLNNCTGCHAAIADEL